jgi:hypothetical protein
MTLTPGTTNRDWKRKEKENLLPTHILQLKAKMDLTDLEKVQMFYGFIKQELGWTYGETLSAKCQLLWPTSIKTIGQPYTHSKGGLSSSIMLQTIKLHQQFNTSSVEKESTTSKNNIKLVSPSVWMC